MKHFLDKLDLWIYSVIGYLLLGCALLNIDGDQNLWTVGSGAIFGIQAIIWRLNDTDKK